MDRFGLLTTPLASDVIIFLHYKTRASTDFAFLLCDLKNQERNDHEKKDGNVSMGN